jgi:hypothetical protein
MSNTILLSDLGAVSDAKSVLDLTIATGSTSLTSGTAVFSAGDVGKTIIVASGGDGTQPLSTTIAAYVSPTQVTLTNAAITAASHTGGAFGTDCGQAFQAALNAAAAAYGGHIIIDGFYLWKTPVVASALATHLRIEGRGSDTGLLVAGGPDAVMFSANGFSGLYFEHVNFVGTLAARDDCRRLLSLTNGFYRLRGCRFVGLANFSRPAASVIYSFASEVITQQCEYAGCAFSSGFGNALIQHETIVGVSSKQDRCIDYGAFGPKEYSKTGIGFSLMWFRVRDQKNPAGNATGQSVVRIEDSRFDEGCVSGIDIAVTPGSPNRIHRVHISGAQMNNTLITGGIAIGVSNTDNVVIEQCGIGWAVEPHYSVGFAGCTNALVDGVTASGGANGLTANGVTNLEVRNSPDYIRFNLTNVTNFREVKNGVGAPPIFTKNGRVSDADFRAPPPIGTQAADRVNRKLYTKLAAVEGWVATALAESTDATFALVNATPANGQVTGGTRYKKTAGAAAWGNTSANLDTTITGSFRMRVKFLSAGTDILVGALDAGNPATTVLPGYNANRIGLLQNAGTTLAVTNYGNILVNTIPYTPGQLAELTYNATTGALNVYVNGSTTPAFTRTVAAASFEHRFGSSIAQIGGEFELISYAPL